MKEALIDTDILSFYIRGFDNIVSKVDSHLQEYPTLTLSIVTYYEVLGGLLHKDAKKQLSAFYALVARHSVLPLSFNSVTMSARWYAEMKKYGTPLASNDLLIAGTALANDLVLVTHNHKHFSRIGGLELEDWTET